MARDEQLISSIRIEGLFGLYTYSLPPKGQQLSDAAILYGDNGIGKSTVLRLAFHLLSFGRERGHRNALYKGEFTKLELTLRSGIKLTAEKIEEHGTNFLNLTIHKGNRLRAYWKFIPRDRAMADREEDLFFRDYVVDKDGSIIAIRKPLSPQETKAPGGERGYLSVLAEYAPTTFILNAERRLDSDSVSDPSDEVELRRIMRIGEPKQINDLVIRAREIALTQALSAANKWISQKALQGANQGSVNVHSVYVDVLHHLTSSSSNAELSNDKRNAETLLNELTSIEQRTIELAKYEMATELSTSEFKKALSQKLGKNTNIAIQLLQPYVQSLEGRLKAVDPIYRVVHNFLEIVNGFLSDKKISYSLSNGFKITNRLGTDLLPKHLSSGEQQLLLLFCYVLVARDYPTVFMIDEPELSLNIKWQRKLVQSLLDLTYGAKIQFLFASHSMELLTQHRKKVVQLVNEQ